VGTEIVCHHSAPHWLRDAEVIEDELPTSGVNRVGRNAPLLPKISRKKAVYAPTPAFENFVFLCLPKQKKKVYAPLLPKKFIFLGHENRKIRVTLPCSETWLMPLLPTFDEIILSNDSSDHKSCNSIIAIDKKVILNINSEHQLSFGIFRLLVNTNQ